MRPAAVALLLATALGGCLGNTEPSGSVDLDFDFNVHGTDWSVGASDFLIGDEPAVNLVGELRNYVAPLDGARTGLYLAGTNPGTGMFAFFKKRFAGVAPGRYNISFRLEIASPSHGGCTTGPGPNVFIKAGALVAEPEAIPGTGGRWVMNINKGTPTSGGEFTFLGDLRNTLSGCPTPGTWGLRVTTMQSQAVPIDIPSDGQFWIFLGMDSNAPGRAEMYFSRMTFTLAL